MKLSNTILALSISFGMISCGAEASNKNETNESNESSEIDENAVGKMYEVDTEKSTIKWTGSKPTEEHFGTLKLNSTLVELKDKVILSGDIAVNMLSMTVTDIEDAESNAKLLGHLTSADFFAVDNYPEAQFRVTENRVMAPQNMMIADLIIKGIVQPAEVPYTVEYEEDIAVVIGSYTFDRTLYSIEYKSKSIFGDLGDKFINDEITLDFNIVLKEAGSN